MWRTTRRFIGKMRASGTWIPAALLSLGWHRLGGRSLVAHQRALILGASRISTSGLVQVGIDPVGFCHRYDRTYLHVRGRLNFNGPYSVGRGCRFDIGPSATASFGAGSITADTKVIISTDWQSVRARSSPGDASYWTMTSIAFTTKGKSLMSSASVSVEMYGSAAMSPS